jgi:hypothetical protein
MVDVHRPIFGLPSKWPGLPARLWSWWELEAWEKLIVERVLKPLWAWNDPTMAFAILPLITYHEPDTGTDYGFQILGREFNTEHWYFRLPGLFTARMIVRKMEIRQDEAIRRQHLLSEFLNRETVEGKLDESK